MENDEQDFKNPTGDWKYDGGFMIELAATANVNHLPTGALGVTMDNRVITVKAGRMRQTFCGVQFYIGGKPFYLGHAHMKCIRKLDGVLIWRNIHHHEV